MRPKPWWLIVSFCGGFLLAMFAEELIVHRRDGELHISAPRLHFITGASLERLRNGAAIPYDFQLSIAADTRTNVIDRVLQRFIVSYDLWEEKYSVTKLSSSGSMRGGSFGGSRERRSVSHLSARDAETWCVDNLRLSTSGINASRLLWVRLEVRVADPRDSAPLFGETGISISRLIELFSHPPHSGQQRWTLEAGPLRLNDIDRGGTRGS